MNKEWSEMNKTLQLQIKRKDTFATGIDTLLELRRNLMEQIMHIEACMKIRHKQLSIK